MTELDQMLQADAQRWRADARPVLDLDEQLAAALTRRHQSRRFVAPAIAAAVVLAVAAGVLVTRAFSHYSSPPAATAPAQIRNIVWSDPRSLGTVTYTGSTMRLFDGCENRLAQLITRHGRLIQGKTLGPVGICTGHPVPAGRQGQAEREAARRLNHFYAVIAGPAAWSRSGTVLTLTTPGKGTVQLVVKGAAPTVTDMTWHLVYYMGTDQNEHHAATLLALTIANQGTFQADLTCGTIQGHATVSATHIQFDNVQSPHCTGPASAAITNVIQAGKVEYAIRGDQLIISTKGGMLIYQP